MRTDRFIKCKLFYLCVFCRSVVDIRFGAISDFRPTDSARRASSQENLRKRVHLFCHLSILETIFSLFLVSILSISEKKTSDSRDISASLCSAQKLIKYLKPNTDRACRNAFMRDFPDFVEVYPYASFLTDISFISISIGSYLE